MLSPAVKYFFMLIFPVFILTFLLFAIVKFDIKVIISFLVSYFFIYQISSNLYHRYWSHKQFTLHPGFERFMSVVGLFAMTGDPISFAKSHRWHHMHSDTVQDFHSPIHGRFHSFIGWLFVKNNMNLDLVNDLRGENYAYLRTLSKYKLVIVWLCLICLGLASRSVLLGVLLAMCSAFLLEMLTNAFAHDPSAARAKNVKWLAWLSLGSYHFDHHENPTLISKDDPGFFLIELLKALKLIRKSQF